VFSFSYRRKVKPVRLQLDRQLKPAAAAAEGVQIHAALTGEMDKIPQISCNLVAFMAYICHPNE